MTSIPSYVRWIESRPLALILGWGALSGFLCVRTPRTLWALCGLPCTQLLSQRSLAAENRRSALKADAEAVCRDFEALWHKDCDLHCIAIHCVALLCIALLALTSQSMSCFHQAMQPTWIHNTGNTCKTLESSPSMAHKSRDSSKHTKPRSDNAWAMPGRELMFDSGLRSGLLFMCDCMLRCSFTYIFGLRNNVRHDFCSVHVCCAMHVVLAPSGSDLETYNHHLSVCNSDYPVRKRSLQRHCCCHAAGPCARNVLKVCLNFQICMGSKYSQFSSVDLST